MRLSKPDAVDSTKRRHFEISIDSPFHILSCRATLANTALPAYTSPETAHLLTEHYECGCPGAQLEQNSPSSIPASVSMSSRNIVSYPQPSYFNDPNSGLVRPMHLLRVPSFNPPAFSEDDPPPPILTPPPQYDSIFKGDPRHSLEDYFSRLALADAIGDEDDEYSMMRSRVELPLTPGGRVNRSMDERRTWLPLDNSAHR